MYIVWSNICKKNLQKIIRNRTKWIDNKGEKRVYGDSKAWERKGMMRRVVLTEMLVKKLKCFRLKTTPLLLLLLL